MEKGWVKALDRSKTADHETGVTYPVMLKNPEPTSEAAPDKHRESRGPEHPGSSQWLPSYGEPMPTEWKEI